MTTKIVKLVGVALAAAVVTACGSGGGGDADTASQPRATDTASQPGATDTDDLLEADGTVLTDGETAITVVESALNAYGAKASWDGDTLRVKMDGSATSPTAFLYCTAVELALTDAQSGVFVYPDGEVACEDDPRKAN